MAASSTDALSIAIMETLLSYSDQIDIEIYRLQSQDRYAEVPSTTVMIPFTTVMIPFVASNHGP